MSTPTLLLYLKRTGHVLAAATLTAAASKDPTPEALAGDLLPVRHSGDPMQPVLADLVNVPAGELALLSVDAAAVPLAAAREFFIDPQAKTTQPLPFTAANTPTLDPATNSTQLSIKFTPPAAANIKLWARIEPINPPAGSQVAPQTVPGEVTPANKNPLPVSFPLSPLASGDYAVLALVPGLVPLLAKFTIP
jgi:hypothetical protein